MARHFTVRFKRGLATVADVTGRDVGDDLVVGEVSGSEYSVSGEKLADRIIDTEQFLEALTGLHVHIFMESDNAREPEPNYENRAEATETHHHESRGDRTCGGAQGARRADLATAERHTMTKPLIVRLQESLRQLEDHTDAESQRLAQNLRDAIAVVEEKDQAFDRALHQRSATFRATEEG